MIGEKGGPLEGPKWATMAKQKVYDYRVKKLKELLKKLNLSPNEKSRKYHEPLQIKCQYIKRERKSLKSHLGKALKTSNKSLL